MALKTVEKRTTTGRHHKNGKPYFVAYTQFWRREDVPDDVEFVEDKAEPHAVLADEHPRCQFDVAPGQQAVAAGDCRTL